MSVDDSGDSLAIPLTSAGIAASSSGGTVRSTAGMSKEEIKELKKLEKQEKRPRAAKVTYNLFLLLCQNLKKKTRKHMNTVFRFVRQKNT